MIHKMTERLLLVAAWLLGLNIGLVILGDKAIDPVLFVPLTAAGAYAPTLYKKIKELKAAKRGREEA